MQTETTSHGATPQVTMAKGTSRPPLGQDVEHLVGASGGRPAVLHLNRRTMLPTLAYQQDDGQSRQ
jgi:hypothetical protein